VEKLVLNDLSDQEHMGIHRSDNSDSSPSLLVSNVMMIVLSIDDSLENEVKSAGLVPMMTGDKHSSWEMIGWIFLVTNEDDRPRLDKAFDDCSISPSIYLSVYIAAPYYKIVWFKPFALET
jgi:hypothetical protein